MQSDSRGIFDMFLHYTTTQQEWLVMCWAGKPDLQEPCGLLRVHYLHSRPLDSVPDVWEVCLPSGVILCRPCSQSDHCQWTAGPMHQLLGTNWCSGCCVSRTSESSWICPSLSWVELSPYPWQDIFYAARALLILTLSVTVRSVQAAVIQNKGNASKAMSVQLQSIVWMWCSIIWVRLCRYPLQRPCCRFSCLYHVCNRFPSQSYLKWWAAAHASKAMVLG